MEDSYPEGAVLYNLGSGDIRWNNGWTAVDAHDGGWVKKTKPDIIADISKLDFPDNHADAMAAIHVIEHFYKWDVQDILKNWLRILKPGGKLILELPCMEKVFAYIAQCVNTNMPMSGTFSVLPLWGDPRYKDPAMNHKWGYFSHTMKQELVMAGYVNITVEKPRYHFPERDMRLTAFKPLPLGDAA